MMSWQIEMLKKISGVKKGQLITMTAGRRTGKSYWSNKAIERLMNDLQQRPVEDLILTEGTVYGSRYYCVEPIGGNWMDMEVWCMDTFGGPGDKIWGEEKAPEPSCRWYVNNRKFWFRDELDRMVFVLKWR